MALTKLEEVQLKLPAKQLLDAARDAARDESPGKSEGSS